MYDIYFILIKLLFVMDDKLTLKAIEIHDYLGTFRDKKGNPPNQTKVGLLVQNYCDLYFKKSKRAI